MSREYRGSAADYDFDDMIDAALADFMAWAEGHATESEVTVITHREDGKASTLTVTLPGVDVVRLIVQAVKDRA